MSEAARPLAADQWIRLRDRGYFLFSARWLRDFVPVCWEAGDSFATERAWVQSAVTDTWQANSGLKFAGWGICADNARGIRIAVKDDGPNDGPHTKALGINLDGVKEGMVLNFSFNTWSQACKSSAEQREMCIRSIAAHEFGHAIGFAHEQNRPDTPGECTEKPQGQNGDTLLTPYDPSSVMNYCNPVYNNNGKLSPCDVQAVQAVYHAPPDGKRVEHGECKGGAP